MNLDKMIFVFGSNLSGIHGAGAAKYAHKERGAKWGVGEGPTGECYALPTKGLNITPMDFNQFVIHAHTFMRYAEKNPHLNFQMTQVGCGLAGFRPVLVATSLAYAALNLENVYFDEAWREYLPEAKFWGTF